MYEEQYAWIRWGDAKFDFFSIINGTRQGSIASPHLWSVYLDHLMKQLRELGVGCHVGNMFMGVLAYADDLILLAPNREAAEQMLALCESWAMENNFFFSTDPDPKKSKSKVVYMCGQKSGLAKPSPLCLGGSKCLALGTYSYTSRSSGTMDQ